MSDGDCAMSANASRNMPDRCERLLARDPEVEHAFCKAYKPQAWAPDMT